MHLCCYQTIIPLSIWGNYQRHRESWLVITHYKINTILLGFQITAMRLNSLDRKEVEEFYEVYRDVVTEYTGMVDELSSGPSLALEISTIPDGEHTVTFNNEYSI